MIERNTHANYCAAYNDCAPADLPKFSNGRDFLYHVATLVAEAGDAFEGADKYKDVEKKCNN